VQAKIIDKPAATAHAASPEPSFAPNIREGGKGRFRTPTILQMEATECGAACLAMILARLGRWIPLEEMRVACGVSRDGSKAANILRAARLHGLAAKGYRKSAEGLAALPFPMIVFWRMNHFVVVEGVDFKTGRAWINDPATGPRVVPAAEFEESFSGICLVFERTAAFEKQGAPPSLVRGFRDRLRGSHGALSFLIFVGLALVIPGLAVPILSQVFIDEVLMQGRHQWVPILLIGIVATAIIRGTLTWLQGLYLARLEVKLAVAHGAALVWHILRLPIDFFAQRYAGDIASRVESNDQVANLLAGDLSQAVTGLFSIVFFAVIMVLYDPLLAALAITLSLLNLLVLRLLWRVQEDISRRVVREQSNLASVSVSGVSSIEQLKAQGGEADFFAKWAGVQANYLNAQQQISFFSAILGVVPGVLATLTNVAILWLGGLSVMEGTMTVGMLVAFQSLVGSFGEPIGSVMKLGGSLNTVKGDMDRLDDVRRYPIDPRLADSERASGALADRQISRLSGRIELRDVVFGYSVREAPLLQGISLTIEPGQRVAFVGGSGSGKSTLAKLINGLCRPWSGSVTFDGKTMDELPHQTFAGSVACVDQEIFLFEGTVRENLTLWDARVPEASIIRALADSELLETIEQRPRRYDAEMQEGGANFSGGQRQRLEIARALVSDPSILVLDEATSALDSLVEKRIDENLRRRGCTCIIVAHRLSTIRDADEIIVLDRGQIAQRGTHETLMEQQGLYRRLLEAESRRHES
jgi:NHLM bacteriocin system ABC transporter peptidase/ATP-binding protein